WWAERHGADVDANGFAGLPPVPVLSTPLVHASALKALAMLGIGRDSVRLVAAGELGGELQALGEPAIVIGNAGDVNTGLFDPIELVAEVSEAHGAWLHIDGAFGLFARVSPRSSALAAGVERAQSVISDGHKWLNVPYDCGFAFVHDRSSLPRTFALAGAYLPDDDRPNYGYVGPEASRRARALAVWATLRAYGRAGYRTMVERHLELATRLGRRVEEEPELELLSPVALNIVCFRYRPAGLAEAELNAHNARLGEAVLADGRVFVGTTQFEGKVAFRPAIVNWRTTERDVDFLVDVLLELGARLSPAHA
ncbi:MAG: pyridoxal-dependent decarboxylase, partial [Actinomycetota bacterium]|nr:pyridoxal-dependent decarboxylase [Actinomycetota bacterium]